MNPRRKLVCALAAALAAAPWPAFPQPAEKMRVIGYLTPSGKPALRDEVFLQGMRELGWIEGKNIRIEIRRAGNDVKRLAAMAQELVQLKVELIVALATPAVAAARAATRSIPIVSLSADPVLLKRVLQNLLTNAIKYTPTDGFIRVDTTTMLKDIVVSVTDTGAGIPLDQRERIFEKFVQGQQLERRGVGLGLAFCKLAVEAHGGRIWVEDGPECGSRFLFTLPLLELKRT